MKTFALSTFVFAALITGASTTISTVSLDFAVKGESSVEVGETVILKPENSDGYSITWTTIQGIELVGDMQQTDQPRDIVTVKDGAIDFTLLPSSSLVLIPTKPGVIRVQCTAINWDKRDFRQVIHRITVKGGDPKDEDEAQPIPPQPDDGVNGWVKSDYLVLVYESKAENISKELAELMNSNLWLKDISEAGLNRPVVYDKDSDEAKTLIANAQDSGTESNVPFMAVMSSEGKWKRSMPVLFGDDLRKELGL